MSWGTVTVGGFALRETLDGEQSGDSLRIDGQESYPPRSRAQVEAAHANVAGLRGRIVPVTFTDKEELTGFYLVTDCRTLFHKWANGAVQSATWQLAMERLGTADDVEIESRVPTIARQTDHAVTPVFWHAPAGGALDYYTGATVPTGSVTRDSADGSITVHLGIPAGVAPRWTVPVSRYMEGSSRILFDGLRRLGTDTPPLSVWEVNNGLVRLQPGSNGRVIVSCWDAGAWRSAHQLRFWTGVEAYLTSQPELSIIRNDPEEVTIRLTYPTAPGRITVDLSLRRGARLVTGVMKRHSATTLEVTTPTGGGSNVVGGVRQTDADADGNRWVIGSARAVSQAATGIYKLAVTRLDFFFGHEVGPVAVAGDAFADLMSQYLGSTGEQVRVIRR